MNFSDSNDICDTCGSRLLPRANYCHFCGKKLATGPGVTSRSARSKREQMPSKPKVTKHGKVAGAGPMLGCLMAILILLVIAAGGVIGSGVWWYQKRHQPQVNAKQEQVQAELAAAVARERETRDRETASIADAAEEKKKRESFEARVASVEGEKKKLEDRIAGMDRKLKIEARLRNGAKGYTDGGRFEKKPAAGDEEESEFEFAPDPAREDNQVLVLADKDVYSAEMWVPDDVDAVRVRFRVLVPFKDGSVNPSRDRYEEEAVDGVEAGVEDGSVASADDADDAADAADDGEDDREKKEVTLRVRLLDENSKVKGKEVVLLSSDEWLELDVIFTELGANNRRLALDVSGFEGEIYLDDVEVVNAFPIRFEPSIYKYYESPAEKIYYWFALRLEAAHQGSVDVGLPRVRGRQIDLSYEVNGEKLSHRFQNFKIEPSQAEVTVGPSGGPSRLYRLEKGRDGAWSIVQILEGG